MKSGEWRVKSGEWRVESEEWRVESEEWRVKSGEWRRSGNTQFSRVHYLSNKEIALKCKEM